MAKLEINEEQCRKWVDSLFNRAVGKGIDYVIQAVKEKMIRDGELSGEENISELSNESGSCENENEDNDKLGDK